MTGLRPPLFGFLPIFFASLRSLLPPSLAPFLLALLAINPAAAAAAGVTSEDRGRRGYSYSSFPPLSRLAPRSKCFSAGSVVLRTFLCLRGSRGL